MEYKTYGYSVQCPECYNWVNATDSHQWREIEFKINQMLELLSECRAIVAPLAGIANDPIWGDHDLPMKFAAKKHQAILSRIDVVLKSFANGKD